MRIPKSLTANREKFPAGKRSLLSVKHFSFLLETFRYYPSKFFGSIRAQKNPRQNGVGRAELGGADRILTWVNNRPRRQSSEVSRCSEIESPSSKYNNDERWGCTKRLLFGTKEGVSKLMVLTHPPYLRIAGRVRRCYCPCGLLLHQCLYIRCRLGLGTLPHMEGFVECRDDDQRQQCGECHAADDDPSHTCTQLSTGTT